MKSSILIGAIALLSSLNMQAQTTDTQAVEQTIVAFAKAGDQNDANALEQQLDANYRVVMNQLFGSTNISVLPREVYLEKIKNKEFGGDKRTVEIQSIVLNGNSATAHVRFIGTKMTFVSLLTLVKDASGSWKMLSDVPVVK